MTEQLRPEPTVAKPSGTVSNAPETGRRVSLAKKAPLLLALVVLWMLLWGSITPLALISGIVVAFAVTQTFYLPPVDLANRFNPFWFAVFVGRFFGELIVASFQVALQAFARRPVPYSAIVRVDLRTRSDFIMTGVSLAVSLVPGSIVLEVDRANSRLYVHALDVSTADEVEKAREHVLSLEHDLLRAWGSADEWAAVRT